MWMQIKKIFIEVTLKFGSDAGETLSFRKEIIYRSIKDEFM